MVSVAHHVVRAAIFTVSAVSITALVAPASAHPVQRPVVLVIDDNDNPIEPALLIANDPPPPPPVFIASTPPPPPRPKLPARNMLGFRIGVGELSIAQQPVITVAIGLVTETRLHRTLRGFAEYEWISLFDATTQVTSSREVAGYGHRGDIGLRHVLVDTTLKHALRFYVDGEIGGGAAWITNTINGDQVIPHGLVGVRFGYDGFSQNHDSPSREFECEVLLRSVIMADSVGLLFGVGMLWGG